MIKKSSLSALADYTLLDSTDIIQIPDLTTSSTTPVAPSASGDNAFGTFLTNLGNDALNIGKDYYSTTKNAKLSELSTLQWSIAGVFVLAGGFMIYKFMTKKKRG